MPEHKLYQDDAPRPVLETMFSNNRLPHVLRAMADWAETYVNASAWHHIDAIDIHYDSDYDVWEAYVYHHDAKNRGIYEKAK